MSIDLHSYPVIRKSSVSSIGSYGSANSANNSESSGTSSQNMRNGCMNGANSRKTNHRKKGSNTHNPPLPHRITMDNLPAPSVSPTVRTTHGQSTFMNSGNDHPSPPYSRLSGNNYNYSQAYSHSDNMNMNQVPYTRSQAPISDLPGMHHPLNHHPIPHGSLYPNPYAPLEYQGPQRTTSNHGHGRMLNQRFDLHHPPYIQPPPNYLPSQDTYHRQRGQHQQQRMSQMSSQQMNMPWERDHVGMIPHLSAPRVPREQIRSSKNYQYNHNFARVVDDGSLVGDYDVSDHTPDSSPNTVRHRNTQPHRFCEVSVEARDSYLAEVRKYIYTGDDEKVRDMLNFREAFKNLRCSPTETEYQQFVQELETNSLIRSDKLKVLEILDLLGSPQVTFRSVSVAGTNGKSTVAYKLATMLSGTHLSCDSRSAPLKLGSIPVRPLSVGLNTSPHIYSVTERISIADRRISRTDLFTIGCIIDLVSEARYVMTSREGRQKNDGHLSSRGRASSLDNCNPLNSYPKLRFFQKITLSAMLYFALCKVDVAVFECGIGARRDCTLLSHVGSRRTPMTVISSIGWDHMKLLGSTLEEIAYEKAGAVIYNGVTIAPLTLCWENEDEEGQKTGVEVEGEGEGKVDDSMSSNHSMSNSSRPLFAPKHSPTTSEKLAMDMSSEGLNTQGHSLSSSLGAMPKVRVNANAGDVAELVARKVCFGDSDVCRSSLASSADEESYDGDGVTLHTNTDYEGDGESSSNSADGDYGYENSFTSIEVTISSPTQSLAGSPLKQTPRSPTASRRSTRHSTRHSRCASDQSIPFSCPGFADVSDYDDLSGIVLHEESFVPSPLQQSSDDSDVMINDTIRNRSFTSFGGATCTNESVASSDSFEIRTEKVTFVSDCENEEVTFRSFSSSSERGAYGDFASVVGSDREDGETDAHTRGKSDDVECATIHSAVSDFGDSDSETSFQTAKSNKRFPKATATDNESAAQLALYPGRDVRPDGSVNMRGTLTVGEVISAVTGNGRYSRALEDRLRSVNCPVSALEMSPPISNLKGSERSRSMQMRRRDSAANSAQSAVSIQSMTSIEPNSMTSSLEEVVLEVNASNIMTDISESVHLVPPYPDGPATTSGSSNHRSQRTMKERMDRFLLGSSIESETSLSILNQRLKRIFDMAATENDATIVWVDLFEKDRGRMSNPGVGTTGVGRKNGSTFIKLDRLVSTAYKNLLYRMGMEDRLTFFRTTVNSAALQPLGGRQCVFVRAYRCASVDEQSLRTDFVIRLRRGKAVEWGYDTAAKSKKRAFCSEYLQSMRYDFEPITMAVEGHMYDPESPLPGSTDLEGYIRDQTQTQGSYFHQSATSNAAPPPPQRPIKVSITAVPPTASPDTVAMHSRCVMLSSKSKPSGSQKKRGADQRKTAVMAHRELVLGLNVNVQRIFVDAAHNKSALTSFVSWLQSLPIITKRVCVLGAVSKDREMKMMTDLIDALISTRNSHLKTCADLSVSYMYLNSEHRFVRMNPIVMRRRIEKTLNVHGSLLGIDKPLGELEEVFDVLSPYCDCRKDEHHPDGLPLHPQQCQMYENISCLDECEILTRARSVLSANQYELTRSGEYDDFSFEESDSDNSDDQKARFSFQTSEFIPYSEFLEVFERYFDHNLGNGLQNRIDPPDVDSSISGGFGNSYTRGVTETSVATAHAAPSSKRIVPSVHSHTSFNLIQHPGSISDQIGYAVRHYDYIIITGSCFVIGESVDSLLSRGFASLNIF